MSRVYPVDVAAIGLMPPCRAAPPSWDRHPQTFTQPVMRSGPSPSIFAYIASPAFQGRFLTLRHGRIDQRHILNVLDRELINVGGGVELLQRGHGSGCGG